MATANPRSTIGMVDGVNIEHCVAPNVVVFSHGFGVRRDSRGMFADIAAAFPGDVGYVLFDYNEDEGEALRITYSADEAERLSKIAAWVRAQPGVTNVAIVAHSRGCIIASLAAIRRVRAVILLAPPLAGGHTRQYFTNKPGAIRRGDDWYIPRSDGSITVIEDGVFDEFERINSEVAILSYAARQSVLVIVAGADGILEGQDYTRLIQTPTITLETIPNAGHDFIDQARPALIHRVNAYLQERFV
jgi:pimeloyl-ACP methyl ester carboxylesterase